LKVQVTTPPLSDPEVQEVIQQLTWDQAKIDDVWSKGKELGVDPRVMLAVLIQEGTGSFNTNALVSTQFWNEEKGQYSAGGSGLQPEFDLDLKDAMDSHVLAKLTAYGHYAKEFRAQVQAAGLGDGNVFQYANYPVPWIKKSGWQIRPGCYATHTEWWKGVTANFDALAGKGATREYSAHLEEHPVSAESPAPAVKFRLTTNGTGWTETIVNQPWIEAGAP